MSRFKAASVSCVRLEVETRAWLGVRFFCRSQLPRVSAENFPLSSSGRS